MNWSNFFERGHAFAIAMVAAIALSACGGGGGEAAPATVIPTNLAITGPAAADTAGAVSFSSSASSLSGLKYSWDFGDGSTSTDAAPNHAYAKAGDYKVTVHVSNSAGAVGEAQYSVSVTNMSLVQGLVCSGAKQSGWCWEQPTPTGTIRYDTFFIDANTGWTVGDKGSILKTTDGGKIWLGQSSGINTAIRVVRFADANNGWAEADNGQMLRTTDGGASWTVSKLVSGWIPNGLQVLDSKTLLAQASGITSAQNSLLTSVDGGLTWKTSGIIPYKISKAGVIWTFDGGVLSKSTDLGASQTPLLNVHSDTATLYTFDSTDDQHLLVSRVSPSSGSTCNCDFWRSQDGGATWDTPAMQGLPTIPAGGRLAISYAGPGVMITGANSTTLYRSGDTGGSWSLADGDFPSPGASSSAASKTIFGLSGEPSAKPQTTPPTSAPLFFALPDGQLMYARYGYILYRSPDNGFNWSFPASWPHIGLPSSAQSLGAQGELINFSDGSSYLSNDKGQTWTQFLAPVPSADPLTAFWAVDAKHALAISYSGKLQASQDGGRSWTVKQTGFKSGSSPRLVFASSKVGWLYVGDGHLYRSTDGGESWAPKAGANFNASYFQFIDESNGFAVSNGRLIQTRDGGLNWVDVAALPATTGEVAFQSATHGLAMSCFNGIAETYDGGQTWTQRSAGSYGSCLLQAVYVDAKTVWVLDAFDGNGVLQSTDGGTTWQQVAVPKAYGPMQFLDANHGWITSAEGLLATADGGKTWQTQTIAISSGIKSVQFVDSKTGWVLGSNGELLATGTGGN